MDSQVYSPLHPPPPKKKGEEEEEEEEEGEGKQEQEAYSVRNNKFCLLFLFH